jgi:hypothetical protein
MKIVIILIFQMIFEYNLMYFFNYFKYIIMKNLFIFIYHENVLETDIINFYKQYYENFIVITQNNNNLINNNFINNIIRNEKLSSYFELENNKNINLFVLNNLNNMNYDNYVFLYGNLLEYKDNIINDLYKNKIYKTKFDVNKFDLNLNSNLFSYIIVDKTDIYEIKKKYLIL